MLVRSPLRQATYAKRSAVLLGQARRDFLPDQNAVEVLDRLHVTPRLWQAGKLLSGERSKEIGPFARQRVTHVLEGNVETVVRGLRRLGSARGLRGAPKKALGQRCGYLWKNRERMG